jgi:flagellar basal body-associated protein FliL
MPEDKHAQAEAYVRKKPKRIVQNQNLIVLLMMLATTLPIPLVGVTFWFIFCVAPAIAIPTILIVWVVSSVSYIVMRLHVERQKKKV